MMYLRNQGGKLSCLRKTFFVVAWLASFCIEALGASKITGNVRNQSRDQPAAGDEVILLRLDHGMQAESRSKTNALGAFALRTQYPGKGYLVRVLHQGVAYDQRASAGDVLSIQVFDSAPSVRGVTASIEILRAGTAGDLLHVSDMYELKNESKPPMTQAGDHTFEVYLPPNAKLDSVLAAGPEKIGVLISAKSDPGETGHYTVSFPLSPGETKFAFNYDLPYDGHAVFKTRLAFRLQQLAVMIPPTMRFSSHSSAFQLLETGRSDYQVQTASQLEAGEGPGFEVSGTGTLPPLGVRAESQPSSQYSAVPSETVSSPIPAPAVLPSFARIGSRLDQVQSTSQFLLLVGLTAVLLAACAFLVWRAGKTRSGSAAKIVRPRARECAGPNLAGSSKARAEHGG
jgi:hypothetical protein